MNKKQAAIITVRMTSSRMPGKVLKPIMGKSILHHIIDRLKYVQVLDDIIVATSTNIEDNPIHELCDTIGVHCYRGSENDVLARIMGAAETYNIDTILYVCGDCACADPILADELLAFFQSGSLDYASNCNEITYPLGQNLEVFSLKALQRLAATTNDPWDREHVTEYFYTHPEMFSCNFLEAPLELTRPHYRLCVDLPIDFVVIENIFKALYDSDKPFSTAEIVKFLDENPEIARLNQMLKYKKYRGAVVGLGRIGMGYDLETTDGMIRTHAGGYLKCSRTKLDAACDANQAAVDKFQAHFNINHTFSSLTTMLRERNPEIISICTPHKFHAEQVIEAVAYPSVKAVFCEKPMAMTSGEVDSIISACRQNQVFLVINYWMRYSNLYRELKQKIHNGYLGMVQNVCYTYSKGLFNSGSHAINLMIFLFGKPLWVQAGRQYEIGTGDNNVDGMMCMENGVMIHFSCCDWHHHFTTEQQIYGTEKMLRIEENGRRVVIYSAQQNPIFPEFRELRPASEENFDCSMGKPMLNAIDELVGLLDGEISVSSSPGEDELLTIKVLEGFRLSVENCGKRITIN